MKRILLLCLLPTLAFAEWGKFDTEFDNEKPWQELEAQMPLYPRDENLLPFEVSAATDNRFFIDRQSISIGSDGVVRYTLVVKSPSGARNISFEGIRCRTAEFRAYAFGRSDGTWSRARTSKWNGIEHKNMNRQHVVLLNDFLCAGEVPAASLDNLVQKLKYGSGGE